MLIKSYLLVSVQLKSKPIDFVFYLEKYGTKVLENALKLMNNKNRF